VRFHASLLDGAEYRLDKIAEMIGASDWGIHDISRVEVDPANPVPRFNMPLELGIHLGARLLGDTPHRRKRALILEADAHRYDRTLSDISGQDIAQHANDPARVISAVRNFFNDHRRRGSAPLPGEQPSSRITTASATTSGHGRPPRRASAPGTHFRSEICRCPDQQPCGPRGGADRPDLSRAPLGLNG